MVSWYRVAISICRGKQDGPSLESSSYLNVSLRYLGPWHPGTLEPLDLGTLGPLPSSNTSSYFPLHPLTSSYLFLLLSSFGIVWLWGGGGWVVTLEDEIGDWLLTFTLILKSCCVGGWISGTSSILLHSLTLTSSHILLIPPTYSILLPNLHPPPKSPPNSSYLLPKSPRWLISSYKKRFQCYSAPKSFLGGWVSGGDMHYSTVQYRTVLYCNVL